MGSGQSQRFKRTFPIITLSGRYTILLWNPGKAPVKVDMTNRSKEWMERLNGKTLELHTKVIELGPPYSKPEVLQVEPAPIRGLIGLSSGHIVFWRDIEVNIWNPGTRKAMTYQHREQVLVVKEIPGGRIASESQDKTIRILHLATHCSKRLVEHEDMVEYLLPLPGDRLASASWDRTIRLWDLSSGLCTTILRCHTDAISSLALLQDGGWHPLLMTVASGSGTSVQELRACYSRTEKCLTISSLLRGTDYPSWRGGSIQ